MDIAIIGAGLMGRWHGQTARKLGARVLGIVDSDITNAEKLAARFPGARPFSSVDELYAAISPAVVHVCTPLSTHRNLCLDVLDHGSHVVCEKPLAETTAEVRSLHEHARGLGLRVYPVHQFACQRGVIRAGELLDELGSISRLAFIFCSAGAEEGNAELLDNILADILPHPFSVMASLWPTNSLAGLDWRYVRRGPGEVLATCVFGDIPVNLSVSMSGRPTRCYMEIQGSKASLHVDFFHGYCLEYPGTVSRLRKITYPFSDSLRMMATAGFNLVRRSLQGEPAYPGLKRLLGDFYSGLGDSANNPQADEVSVAVAQARDDLLATILRDG